MTEQLIRTSGKLCYVKEQNKVILELDWDFAPYYLSLIPRYYEVRGQRYRSHISVVRKESPDPLQWGWAGGRRFEVAYSPAIQTDATETYWWLDAWSPDLCAVRRRLGLPEYRRNGRLPGDRFHITIGNKKAAKND